MIRQIQGGWILLGEQFSERFEREARAISSLITRISARLTTLARTTS
jgi:hypothetical protein